MLLAHLQYTTVFMPVTSFYFVLFPPHLKGRSMKILSDIKRVPGPKEHGLGTPGCYRPHTKSNYQCEPYRPHTKSVESPMCTFSAARSAQSSDACSLTLILTYTCTWTYRCNTFVFNFSGQKYNSHIFPNPSCFLKWASDCLDMFSYSFCWIWMVIFKVWIVLNCLFDFV